MITRIEALNYKCLRYVSKTLNSFHVLVGPNASGKTTFLDVIGFLSDVVSEGLDEAISSRTKNLEELFFRLKGESLEFAVEALIPDRIRESIAKFDWNTARYEIKIGYEEGKHGFEFKAEKFLLKKTNNSFKDKQRSLFPESPISPRTLQSIKGARDTKLVVNKVSGGNDNFYNETAEKGWEPSFKLGTKKSALGNLPPLEKSFPTAMWFRELLRSGVQRIILNSQRIKQPSPPTKIAGFLPDGSNLPWVISRFRRENRTKYKEWIAHLNTALEDLVDITTIERPEDKHRYLVFKYKGNLKVPSWLVSDGALRIAALTLPAYFDSLQEGIYLVEEPENGIHPCAVQAVYDSLSSVYKAQVLLATHSPVILNAASIEHVLCFAKDQNGATDIVLGREHPKLKNWRGEVRLGTLLASGILS